MSEQPSEAHDSAPPKKNRRPRDPEQWIRRPMEKDRERVLPFRPSPAFFELADPLINQRRTLLGYDRLYAIWQVARNVVAVPGAVAEIGSYRGGSASFMAQAFVAFSGEEVPLHVFDTFEGHPQDAITAHDEEQQPPGRFGGTSYEDVRDLLSPFAQVRIHRGDVAASLPTLEALTYRLVHIDTDLYQPTVVCLEYFAPRLSSGGVLIVDDYSSRKCPGVAKAVVEYLERDDAFQVWDMRTEQLILVRR
jgi:hypothetical protein